MELCLVVWYQLRVLASNVRLQIAPSCDSHVALLSGAQMGPDFLVHSIDVVLKVPIPVKAFFTPRPRANEFGFHFEGCRWRGEVLWFGKAGTSLTEPSNLQGSRTNTIIQCQPKRSHPFHIVKGEALVVDC